MVEENIEILLLCDNQNFTMVEEHFDIEDSKTLQIELVLLLTGNGYFAMVGENFETWRSEMLQIDLALL